MPFFIFPGLFNWVNSIRINRFLKDHNLVAELAVIHAHVCYPSAYLANSIAAYLNVRTMIQHHGIDVIQLLNGRFRLLTKIQKGFLKNFTFEKISKQSPKFKFWGSQVHFKTSQKSSPNRGAKTNTLFIAVVTVV